MLKNMCCHHSDQLQRRANQLQCMKSAMCIAAIIFALQQCGALSHLKRRRNCTPPCCNKELLSAKRDHGHRAKNHRIGGYDFSALQKGFCIYPPAWKAVLEASKVSKIISFGSGSVCVCFFFWFPLVWAQVYTCSIDLGIVVSGIVRNYSYSFNL